MKISKLGAATVKAAGAYLCVEGVKASYLYAMLAIVAQDPAQFIASVVAGIGFSAGTVVLGVKAVGDTIDSFRSGDQSPSSNE